MDKIKISPLSIKAKEAVLQYIQEMDLRKGTKLPREEDMAKMLGVSRITVRKAFGDLAAEGKIFRQQGRGTFVNTASLNMQVTFNPVMEFMQMIRKSGYTPSMKMLNYRILTGKNEVRDEIGEFLGIAPDESIVEAHKAFFADDKLCMMSRDFYSLALAGGEEKFQQFSQEDKSVYPYIYEKSGRKLAWDKVEIDTAFSTEISDFAEFIKEHNIGLKAYLYLKEYNYDEDNRPLIYVEEYIDTSIIKYNMIRQKNITYGKNE